LVALTIVAVLAAGAVMGIGAVTNADLRSASKDIATSVRYLWAQAASTGFAHRLVFDFESNSIKPEFADGRLLLKNKNADSYGNDDEDEEAGPIAGEDGGGDTELGGLGNLFGGLDGSGLEDMGRTPRVRKPAFSTFDAIKGLRAHSLPSGIRLRMVYISHMPEPMEAGTAELYFWPGGMTERALIHVANRNNTFSILVHPVTGRAEVFAEEIELPSDLKSFDSPEEERYE